MCITNLIPRCLTSYFLVVLYFLCYSRNVYEKSFFIRFPLQKFPSKVILWMSLLYYVWTPCCKNCETSVSGSERKEPLLTQLLPGAPALPTDPSGNTFPRVATSILWRCLPASLWVSGLSLSVQVLKCQCDLLSAELSS